MIAGATVAVLTQDRATQVESTITNEDGYYGFWIPSGTYLVRATRAGYQQEEQTVTLALGEKKLDLDFTLRQE